VCRAGRIASSVQVYVRNNLRTAVQIFTKFGIGIFMEIVELLQFLLGKLAFCSHLMKTCIPAYTPTILFRGYLLVYSMLKKKVAE